MGIMHKKHASPAAKEQVKAKENKSKKILDHKQSVLHAIVQAAHHLTHKEAGTKHDKKHAEHKQIRGEIKATEDRDEMKAKEKAAKERKAKERKEKACAREKKMKERQYKARRRERKIKEKR